MANAAAPASPSQPSIGVNKQAPDFQYPRDAGKGAQMDFTEVMELNDEGLIQRHCVYWGWFGVRVLQRNEYHL
jgi:hypothetical protein